MDRHKYCGLIGYFADDFGHRVFGIAGCKLLSCSILASIAKRIHMVPFETIEQLKPYLSLLKFEL